MLKYPYMLIIAGPTGVGKSDFAEMLARELPAEIVNADMGQCYTPLTVGTAKPNWHESDIPHHGFDTINEPHDLTVMAYRERLKEIMTDIWQRGKLPIVVGGSSFYLASLFFPPKADVNAVPVTIEVPQEDLWLELFNIDPQRAQQIAPNDYFRIRRALAIWRTTGTKPSCYVPTYEPMADYHMVFLTRDTQELNERIAVRVEKMLQTGWIEEVQALKGTDWEPFLLRKKIIGYDDILKFLDVQEPTVKDRQALALRIIQRTCQYGKRQRTFWRMLEARLKEHPCPVETVNLSEIDMKKYAQELVHGLKKKLLADH